MIYQKILKKIFVMLITSGLIAVSSVIYANGNDINGPVVTADQGQQLQLTAVSPVTDDSVANTSSDYHSPVILSGQSQTLFPPPDTYQQQAFNDVARQAMPLTPSQIVTLKKMLAETQRASAATPGTPPQPTVSTQLVSLAPGVTPPVIRLQQGFVTSVVFVDSTGADWPIESYDLGNSKAFNIQVQQDTNTMMIQALNMYTYGNLAVKLKGLSTPVMLTLVPGQQVVDYRIDLRIQGLGPNAQMSAGQQGLPSSVSAELLGALDGIPPQGSKLLQIEGDDSSQVWLVGDKMYLRTPLIVLSPGWESVVTSPDGTRAYEMAKSPTILVSKYGKPEQLTIEGL